MPNFSDPPAACRAVRMMSIWAFGQLGRRDARERASHKQALPRRRDGLVCGRKLTISKLTLTPA